MFKAFILVGALVFAVAVGWGWGVVETTKEISRAFECKAR